MVENIASPGQTVAMPRVSVMVPPVRRGLPKKKLPRGAPQAGVISRLFDRRFRANSIALIRVYWKQFPQGLVNETPRGQAGSVSSSSRFSGIPSTKARIWLRAERNNGITSRFDPGAMTGSSKGRWTRFPNPG